jgi:hypothetical protein
MGLAEQIRAGAVLSRRTFTINTDASGVGSASLGAAYVLLAVQTSSPCRFRLYDNEASRNNTAEGLRQFGNTNVSASVALIGDFSMSAANITYTITPPMFAVTQDNQYTYYSTSNAQNTPTITLTRYLIEDTAVPVTVGGRYSVANRRTLPYITGSLAAGAMVSGTLLNSIIPQTYLLVSASVTGSLTEVRLRLYSTSQSITNTAEKNRPFSTEPSQSISLIVDAIITGSNTYFIPKIVGANLQNMGTNLNTIQGSQELLAGKNELYYILENIATGGGTQQISASLHVYSLQD